MSSYSTSPPSMPTVSFDMRLWYYQQLDEIMRACSAAARSKDVEGWYRCLEDLSGRIVLFLSKEKQVYFRGELDKLFNRVYDSRMVNFNPSAINIAPAAKQFYIEEYTRLLRALRAYNDALFAQLNELGMLLPKKADLTTVVFGKNK